MKQIELMKEVDKVGLSKGWLNAEHESTLTTFNPHMN